ncbi:MAG: endolytic transglycosylase MltG [Candidatus Tyrphobacter sp.]
MRIVRAVAAAALAAIVIVVAFFAYAAFLDRSRPEQPTTVVISSGSSFDAALATLRRSGVIAHALPLHVLARLRGDERRVRAGEYRFAPHETEAQVLHALVTQGAAVARWVTVPEGFTMAQIAQRLEQSGIGSAQTFESSFRKTPFVLDGTRMKNLEGVLFPDTYLLPVGASPRQVESEFERSFASALPADARARARALHLSVAQVVVVASLVEREAKIGRDRAMIAGVIYNRLRLNMPLQIDASIEYALPRHATALTRSDLAIASPYNTYLHTGLPPTPIANPGRASLEAAFDPAATNALYYVYCGRGGHVFAQTLVQHEANVARCLK